MNKCDNKGSASIEAAVIVPLLLMIFAVIIHLSVFLYDKCSLERAAAMAALRGSEAVRESNNVRYQIADEGVTELLENGLLGAETVEKQIQIKGNQIKICLTMQYKWWKFQVETEKKAVNPVEFVRTCRKVKGVIEKEP
jgi:Flp pilus assembly protein TadG